ncbi:pentapeptide repeat-containing protein [Kaistella sp.]|uniref:pentapeptide repeat-containing protein n=1 Tax=Kaistella sp. TaxID=2782235 RepID=UPI003C378540
MSQAFTQDQNFNKLDFRQEPLIKGEYENCLFTNCNFEEVNLTEFKFVDCEFRECNWSLALLHGTVLREVKFKDCKMLGLQFETCNDFGLSFSFENCQLNHSTFFQMNIKKIIFRNCQLREIDFSESNLSSVVFDNCDLSQAIFAHSILDKADFRTAYNYSIDPENNRIKKAKFSILGISGLLDKYDIVIQE